MITSFAEKHCESGLSTWLIVDTVLLISKLFIPFVPICSQFTLYICYLGEFVKNKTHRFQCFPVNAVIIKRVYKILAAQLGNQIWQTEWKTVPLAKVQLYEYENQNLEAAVVASHLYANIDIQWPTRISHSYGVLLHVRLTWNVPRFLVTSGNCKEAHTKSKEISGRFT